MAELALVPQSSSIAMVEKNRLDTLAGYNAKEHLVKWIANQNGKSVVVEYYPAAWRLYELSLRYGDANFANDIIHMDVEKNIVVIRSRLYLGADYVASPKKSEAHKYGKLTELDKVETKAMARAARNFGIGTEHALDFDDVEPDPHATVVNADPGTQNGNAPTNQRNSAKQTVDADPPQLSVDQLQALCEELFGPGKWAKLRVRVLPPEEVGDIPDALLSQAHLARIYKALDAHQKAKVTTTNEK